MSNIEIKVCDITKLNCDAIVNAANNSLLGGSGVDGAIHKAAGEGLLRECRTLNGCKTGEAKITRGYDLPAKYVIHTVGPVYSGSPEDRVLLRNCYMNSLDLAKKYDLHSIAFPTISTGAYGYPKEEAAKIAVTSVRKWVNENDDYHIDVTYCCFDVQMYDIYMNAINIVSKV